MFYLFEDLNVMNTLNKQVLILTFHEERRCVI